MPSSTVAPAPNDNDTRHVALLLCLRKLLYIIHSDARTLQIRLVM